jgi:hypothetical protein
MCQGLGEILYGRYQEVARTLAEPWSRTRRSDLDPPWSASVYRSRPQMVCVGYASK